MLWGQAGTVCCGRRGSTRVAASYHALGAALELVYCRGQRVLQGHARALHCQGQRGSRAFLACPWVAPEQHTAEARTFPAHCARADTGVLQMGSHH